MAGTIVADTIQADSTSTLVLKNGVANTPPTIQDSAGTQIGTFCRAWVNWNGTTNTGGFCTIRGSFNVTSVADNGTGDQTINFTTAMPDANYAAAGMTNYGSFICLQEQRDGTGTDPSASALRVQTMDHASNLNDNPWAYVAIFR
jgi:hypothetical protein